MKTTAKYSCWHSATEFCHRKTINFNSTWPSFAIGLSIRWHRSCNNNTVNYPDTNVDASTCTAAFHVILPSKFTDFARVSLLSLLWNRCGFYENTSRTIKEIESRVKRSTTKKMKTKLTANLTSNLCNTKTHRTKKCFNKEKIYLLRKNQSLFCFVWIQLVSKRWAQNTENAELLLIQSKLWSLNHLSIYMRETIETNTKTSTPHHMQKTN